jgi:hypothetical protein
MMRGPNATPERKARLMNGENVKDTRPTLSRSRFRRITAQALGADYTAHQLADILKMNPRTIERLGRPSHPIRADMLRFYAQSARASGAETLAGIYEAEAEALDATG